MEVLDNILVFLLEHYDIFFYALGVVLFILSFIFNNQKLKEISKSMIYRTGNGDLPVEKGQEFNPMVDEYKYSEELGCAVKVGKRNQQEYIDSFADCELRLVLDKFLSSDDVYKTPLVDDDDSGKVMDGTERYRDDLIAYGAVMEQAEAYREQFNLPQSATLKEIFMKVAEQNETYKAYIQSKIKPKTDEVDSGGAENA